MIFDSGKNQNESYYDYLVRLAEHKNEYGLTWTEIAALLNDVTQQNFGECTYRKFYTAFKEGMQYQRSLTEPGICAKRILTISDLHVPFQKPVKTFWEYCGKIDVLQLNGDIVDCSAISKFPKAYRSSPMEEIIEGRQYLIDLIEYLKPSEVIVVYGNHDIRMENYLAKSLDSDLLELMPRTSLELIFEDGFTHYSKKTRAKVRYEPLRDVFDGIDISYNDNWFCQVGDTMFCHPLAFAAGALKTAEKAMYYFRNEGYDFKNLVMAHTHRIGSYVIGNTTLYEQGACCETKQMHYSDGKLVNSQKEGFLYLEQDISGAVIGHKQIILN